MSNPEQAPVQGDSTIRHGEPGHGPGIIEWSEHEDVWRVYAKKFGNGQTAVRIAQRGGFGYREIVDLIGHAPTTWRPIETTKR